MLRSARLPICKKQIRSAAKMQRQNSLTWRWKGGWRRRGLRRLRLREGGVRQRVRGRGKWRRLLLQQAGHGSLVPCTEGAIEGPASPSHYPGAAAWRQHLHNTHLAIRTLLPKGKQCKASLVITCCILTCSATPMSFLLLCHCIRVCACRYHSLV
jgi:hypothetical protein